MLFNRLLLAASAATALLVVPETSDNEDGVFRTLPIDVESYDVPATALVQTIEVPCRQCRGRDSHLKLDFTVQDSTRLLLNGFELYPNADPWQGDLTAAVVRENGKSKDQRLGYGLAIRPMGMDEDQKLEVIGLELLIIEVGDRFIDGVPPVSVKLIKALSGEILIGSIDMNESAVDSQEQCSTFWCRVDRVFEHYWNGLKTKVQGMGCKGMRGHGHGHKGHRHGQHKSEHEAEIKKHGDEKHEHHSKFGHKHHHHHEHSWSVAKHIASYIILPLIMGMATGVGVAVVTMFIGALLLRLIRMVRGEAYEAPQHTDHKVEIVEFLAADEEKAGLIEHQEAPPQYEDEPSRD